MQIISVNIGQEQTITTKSGKTGIYKTPSVKPVQITAEGLHNDAIVDTENHGGVDQAVYIYGQPDYEWWSRELGYPLQPGTFGENITVSDLESTTLCIGDRLQMGTVVLEVTSPRIPCVTLATRMNDSQFVKKFVQGKRYGAYCRVIQIGQVEQNDDVALIPYAGEQVSINEMADAFYQRDKNKAQLEKFLRVPVAIRARKDYERQLR